ncbi:hypothetical protein AcV5_005258 [Taiwanofungus camphoratus]|nr:hypothetical protein AcW2_000136 [Antrodia cinnamomea]KAI0937324.1 hypothetical protein AcV5_005258 [Antrodia cinnamomea]KAI0962537.1 hypothetical protein AcV7_001360 [Antrodia cinnamomea]
MSSNLKPIDPKSPRWEPTADPHDIVVPGLDTAAPTYDQIEQVEQLITIKLQNIDANFSKMQQIMANRILPAFKRYAVGTEPVREAAKFWTTFFEQAAQIRVPTYDEYDSLHEQQETRSTSESDAERVGASGTTSTHLDTPSTPIRSHQTFNPDGTTSEVSFMPGQAAISSTPATTYMQRAMHQHDSFAGHDSDPTPSWTTSLESPLVRLDREIQSLSQDDEVSNTSAAQQVAQSDETEEVTQRQIQPPSIEERSVQRVSETANGKGKARELMQPLLHNVLRRNASTVDPSLASARKTAVSPLKIKPKTPILKAMNPYLPPGTKPTEWKGVVDLADPSVTTPRKGHLSSATLNVTARPAGAAQPTTPRYTDDDSLDVDFGMSPPITMDFARLPKLGRTPKKDAAERILQNIIDVERRGVFGEAPSAAGGSKGNDVESSASTMPTLPSLSKYNPQPSNSETSGSVDASLGSIMRRVGLNIPGFASTGAGGAPSGSVLASTSTHSGSYPQIPSSSVSTTSSTAPVKVAPPPTENLPPVEVQIPLQQQVNIFRLQDDEFQPPLQDIDPDDSSDSLEYEVHNTANPSAAFLLASQRGSYDDDDDSFASDNSIDEIVEGDMEPIHPFARGLAAGDVDAFDDDSFDDSALGGEAEEETVFGVPPAQRLQAQARNSEQNLRMLGEELFQDTIGKGAGRVDESPTPYMAPR